MADGNGVQVYSVGLVRASACAPADTTRDEIERVVNLEHPTGIGSRWQISEDSMFSGGEPMPAPCDQNPDGRRHWLLNC